MSTRINFGVDYTGQLKSGDPASDLPPMEDHCAIDRTRIFLRCTPSVILGAIFLAANLTSTSEHTESN
jgi:hypothetical protein